ncbi:LCP family protein [Micromonospora zhanjiangensis]|uniref:LCP family protein n=1 Tax=Micromonospora zhanjiangensis TaxID=1522057 RepID=A0ABV8KU31_9ACTN
MIEDELRATFARHEQLVPAAGPVRSAIDRLVVRRRRRRLAIRTTGAALAVLVAAGVPVVGRQLTTAPPVGPAPAGSAPADGPLNVLILGAEGSAASGYRADSVIVAHLPRGRDRVFLVALPRDLWVADIPGSGAGKLNTVLMAGGRAGGGPDLAAGARLAARTVTGVTGVPIDGTAVLTFAGLRNVTDAVGGVPVCLPQTVRSRHTDRRFPAGCQRLDGRAALDLLRQRYDLPDGGMDRDRNAQRFAAGLLHQVTGTDLHSDPIRLAALVRAAGAGLVVDGLSMSELLALLPGLGRAEPVGIGWRLSDTRDENGGLRLDPAVSRSLFDAIRGDAVAGWAATHRRNVTDLD